MILTTAINVALRPFLPLFSAILPLLPPLAWQGHPSYETALFGAACLLFLLSVFQLSGFSTPPPPPIKRLPRDGPSITLDFAPDGPNDDLPTSFAPLLSSSHLTTQMDLPPDLLHAFQTNTILTFTPGSHQIPFSKSPHRPPLIITVPKPSSSAPPATATITSTLGSDNLVDSFVPLPPSSRSQTTVQSLTITLSQPLTLSNVTATLLHLPSLFTDNAVKTFNRIQVINWGMQYLNQMTSLVEKVLWNIESMITLNLTSVKASRSYRKTLDQHRLTLSFTGQVLFLGLPIPFINVTLPTFIIPSLHAKISDLMTQQPLSSGKIHHSKVPVQRIVEALHKLTERVKSDVKIVLTLPKALVKIKAPGGMEGEVEIKLCSPVKQRRNSTSNTTHSANSSKNNSLHETDSVDVNEEHVWIFDSSFDIDLRGDAVNLKAEKAVLKRGDGCGDDVIDLRATLSLSSDNLVKNIMNETPCVIDYGYEITINSFDLDRVSFVQRASHNMLVGGTELKCFMNGTSLQGVFASQQNSKMRLPIRKRDFLKYLPKAQAQFNIQEFGIDEGYTDDGMTRLYPDLKQGRVQGRIMGGEMRRSGSSEKLRRNSLRQEIVKGLRLEIDFGGEFYVRGEGRLPEFPELDIFENEKMISNFDGNVSGSVVVHLLPPEVGSEDDGYHIECSSTRLSVTLERALLTMSHRRLILPSNSRISVKILESKVNMALDGVTQCEVSWDMQGASPVLQVTDVGKTLEETEHEDKRSVEVLLKALRQGRLNLNVSQVGGIHVTSAATGRESKEGLFDWKFFNAIVSPDADGAQRLLSVLEHRPTVGKVLEVTELINPEISSILKYAINHFWRAKDILEQEGVSDPKHVIPGEKMGRLASLLLKGDLSEFENCLKIVQRVTSGEGLDVVASKELLRLHLAKYEDYAAEIDRTVRWAAMLLNPIKPPVNYVETDVHPLSEDKNYNKLFRDIPAAKEIYTVISRDKQVPLSLEISRRVSLVAPYLSLKQIQFLLDERKKGDWQVKDLRRIKYISSVKKKVMDISESYGGLSFLPQSFLVSVFVGEATRKSLKAEQLREGKDGEVVLSPAGRIASYSDFRNILDALSADADTEEDEEENYELGDSLLGPSDVAILLQAGLTSPLKGSTVVQLNQRMLLDLIASQPRSFAVAVLAEIGTPGGHGSARVLAGALMALLETNQDSFQEKHKLDMCVLLETWLGFPVPRRDHYMAGGRWARQSYYDAIFRVAKNILEDARPYMALKGHLQRTRENVEEDPIPLSPLFMVEQEGESADGDASLAKAKIEGSALAELGQSLKMASVKAIELIAAADDLGEAWLGEAKNESGGVAEKRAAAVDGYKKAFAACAEVLSLDKHAFQASWFKSFWRRNYDSLMILSLYENLRDDVDNVRKWMDALKGGAEVLAIFKKAQQTEPDHSMPSTPTRNRHSSVSFSKEMSKVDFFTNMDTQKPSKLELVKEIIEGMFFDDDEKRLMGADPLVHLLLPNDEGKYDFTIISAMGVITEGKKGTEMEDAYARIKAKRGVDTIRADTATVRSFEYNASKIEEAIEGAIELGKPYGYVGYSQGCANSLTAESLMNSGTPKQRAMLKGLKCRQLLFSAANGSLHGSCSDKKAQKLIVMGEEAFKYHQGYFSRAFISTVLGSLNEFMDSAAFMKFLGGAQSMLPEGCRAFWREAQHKSDVPTCVIRAVLEDHTTPEALEMLSATLTNQSGSDKHDSQVHVYDAVGHPVYTKNRNGDIMLGCDMGGAIQRTHHWSPLNKEVSFVATARDEERCGFDCAKDRHIFPWVEVNARFGVIKMANGVGGWGGGGGEE
ncbi:hypothetical protein TrLO_g2083 [Triparma laevis f. longispina]|uniref:Uncharacterized protein n=1 Tax=Triparma laevis f. longispina TaxID=1714387 RepID=A0A9W7KY13_9STRA|nr:hypothetical protein TrLO_g2083 [Triparma laevis f. longispina]